MLWLEHWELLFPITEKSSLKHTFNIAAVIVFLVCCFIVSSAAFSACSLLLSHLFTGTDPFLSCECLYNSLLWCVINLYEPLHFRGCNAMTTACSGSQCPCVTPHMLHFHYTLGTRSFCFVLVHPARCCVSLCSAPAKAIAIPMKQDLPLHPGVLELSGLGCASLASCCTSKEESSRYFFFSLPIHPLSIPFTFWPIKIHFSYPYHALWSTGTFFCFKP